MFNLIGEIILNTLGKYFINLDEAVSDNETEETIKYNITSSEISFIFENTSFIIQKTDSKYNEIYNAVLSNDAEKLKTLVLTDKTLKEEIKDFVKMDVFYNDIFQCEFFLNSKNNDVVVRFIKDIPNVLVTKKFFEERFKNEENKKLKSFYNTAIKKCSLLEMKKEISNVLLPVKKKNTKIKTHTC